MKPLGNFKDGQLGKLHLQATERCNIDDSVDARELSWVEAFRLMGDATYHDPVADPDPIRDLLCQNCGFADRPVEKGEVRTWTSD